MRLHHPNQVIQENLEHFPGKTKIDYIQIDTKYYSLRKKTGITREQILILMIDNSYGLKIIL